MTDAGTAVDYSGCHHRIIAVKQTYVYMYMYDRYVCAMK